MPADIPSPSSGTLTIGPLSLNAYGLMIALGVIAAVWLFGRRLEQKGIGTRDDANAIAIWAVLAGVIGARLYHVITDWERFEGRYGDIVKIWEGGLGIPGGILLGTLVGVYFIRRRGLPLGPAVNAAAPALPLAQAIGRWGNYFNQELFGSPTDLPWALEVDDQTALDAGYPPGTTFHPTFLYESLCNFALCGLLLWIDKRFNPAGGRLFAMYVLGYGIIRFWVEGLRIDPADELGGLRWNQWVALACVVGGGLYLIATRDKPKEILVPAGAGRRPRRRPRRMSSRASSSRPSWSRVSWSRTTTVPPSNVTTATMTMTTTMTTTATSRTPRSSRTRRAAADDVESIWASKDRPRRATTTTSPEASSSAGRADDAETSDAGAGGGVEDVQAVGPGDQADPVARDVGAEALGAGDDLRRGQLVSMVDGVVGAVEERLRPQLLDHGDRHVEPALGADPPVLGTHADGDRVRRQRRLAAPASAAP